MLKFSTNRAQDTPVGLTPDEDRKLRLAFGRFAKRAWVVLKFLKSDFHRTTGNL